MPAFAQEFLENGTLQAYWSKEWNAKGTVSTPRLGFRYLTQDHKKFIAIAVKGDQIKFIKEHFKNIPHNFFKYKEWYVNQTGNLTLYKVKQSTLCNASIYNATLLSFTPNYSAPPTNTALYELTAQGGCNQNGHYPYIITYLIKEGLNDIDVKEKPSDNAKTIEKATRANDIFIKIKTIDNDWIYTGIYDAASPNLILKPRGYVRIRQLELQN